MPIGRIEFSGHATKRQWTVYILVAKPTNKTKKCLFYVGKTGDNREGCNPVISRVGNHFSYNKAHSQMRNKLGNTEEYNFDYHYCHFGKFEHNNTRNSNLKDRVNELERELNRKLQQSIDGTSNYELLNKYLGKSVTVKETNRRNKLLTNSEKSMLDKLVQKTLSITSDIR